MSKVRKAITSKKQIEKSPFNNYWIKENYIFLLIGILVLILGFFLMAQDPYDSQLSLSFSPIVLLFAYIIIFPLSILFRKKKSKE
ncbi:MAG: hypothetical protein A2068_11090 [Ignavibacteria bacterium GWB2_35_6b]|nr:MAG: hypothetical protein A2068_11090 [Ignavibacteria bacterium GWB2_35_6b]